MKLWAHLADAPFTPIGPISLTGAIRSHRASTCKLNRRRLRFARARAYIRGMDRGYWQRKLQEADAGLDAARTRTQVNEAAKKLQYAKAQLRALEESTKACEAAV